MLKRGRFLFDDELSSRKELKLYNTIIVRMYRVELYDEKLNDGILSTYYFKRYTTVDEFSLVHIIHAGFIFFP